MTLNFSGLKPGGHGFTIHEKGVKNNDCSTAGAHFNPTGVSKLRPKYF